METKIVIRRLYKFKRKWKIKKARRVVALMNKVINSTEFEKEILAYEFTDRRYRATPHGECREIHDNNEIYAILKKGNEQYADENDYKWTMNIKLGRFLKQVGRREKNLIITQNWFFKKPHNDHEVAAHWFHEYSHVLGFRHDFERTERRPHSVPYGLGNIVEKLLNPEKNKQL